MTIDESYVRDLHTFLGYGSPTAKLVFFGLEEHGSDRKFDREREPFVDLHEHHALYGLTIASRRTHVWTIQAAFALALLEGPSPSRNRTARTRYRNERLGRSDGDTLLAELGAVRRESTSSPALRDSLDAGLRRIYDEADHDRWARLQRHLRATEPPYIICYGKSAWPAFRQRLGNLVAGWCAETIGRLPIQLGRSVWGGVVVLCPFFGNGQLMGDLDVEAIAARLKAFVDSAPAP